MIVIKNFNESVSVEKFEGLESSQKRFSEDDKGKTHQSNKPVRIVNRYTYKARIMIAGIVYQLWTNSLICRTENRVKSYFMDCIITYLEKGIKKGSLMVYDTNQPDEKS